MGQPHHKPYPHTHLKNLRLRQALFLGFFEHAPHAAAPLLNQVEFPKHACNHMVADFGHALAHVLDRHAWQKDTGVFNFNAIIKKGDSKRRTALRIVGMHQRINDRFTRAGCPLRC